MNIPRTFLVTLLGLAAATSLPAQEQGAQMMEAAQLAVSEAVITTAVTDRTPGESLTMVAADVGELFCWTRITGAQGEIEIAHVWYKDDQEMARVSLRVASASWRTWSSKKIDPSWTGNWRVDVVGPDGAVLESVPFTIG